MPAPRQPSLHRIATAQRAVAILDTLAENGDLGTNELARRVALPASTVSRQLGTLTDAGLVEHDAASGRYRLGIRLVQLANAVLARLDVRTEARPHLEELVRITGETATLHVPGEEDAITVDFVPSAHYVQHVTQLGRPSIGHATSAGKVMLAFSERTLPTGPLRAFTKRTLTTRAALAAELEHVRVQGYAEAYEERESGLNAVAAPVFAASGALAAILALQGPSVRFGPDEAHAALPHLLERARAVSRALGWEG
ncbi:MAG: IclR family transcriptional regulator [Thermoleophilia bacterium]|nr:IclR family transcriptional regulator [Thermoleophilia bacterium]